MAGKDEIQIKPINELHESREIKGVYTVDDSGKSCQAGNKHR